MLPLPQVAIPGFRFLHGGIRCRLCRHDLLGGGGGGGFPVLYGSHVVLWNNRDWNLVGVDGYYVWHVSRDLLCRGRFLVHCMRYSISSRTYP